MYVEYMQVNGQNLFAVRYGRYFIMYVIIKHIVYIIYFLSSYSYFFNKMFTQNLSLLLIRMPKAGPVFVVSLPQAWPKSDNSRQYVPRFYAEKSAPFR